MERKKLFGECVRERRNFLAEVCSFNFVRSNIILSGYQYTTSVSPLWFFLRILLWFGIFKEKNWTLCFTFLSLIFICWFVILTKRVRSSFKFLWLSLWRVAFRPFCSLSFHLRLPGWEFEIVKLYFKWVFSNGTCLSILGYFWNLLKFKNVSITLCQFRSSQLNWQK